MDPFFTDTPLFLFLSVLFDIIYNILYQLIYESSLIISDYLSQKLGNLQVTASKTLKIAFDKIVLLKQNSWIKGRRKYLSEMKYFINLFMDTPDYKLKKTVRLIIYNSWILVIFARRNRDKWSHYILNMTS